MSADGKAIGTIEIKDAIIQTPAGGKVIDYRNKEELSDGIVYEAGQTIGTGDATIDSPYDAAVAKSTVIVPPEEIKPRGEARRDQARGSKSEGTKTTKTVAAATAGAKTTGILAATGDTSSAAIIATPCRNGAIVTAPWRVANARKHFFAQDGWIAALAFLVYFFVA